MSARFHPGVTNCGGALAHSGCGCASASAAEAGQVTLVVAEGRDFYAEQVAEVEAMLPELDDATFARVCEYVDQRGRDAVDGWNTDQPTILGDDRDVTRHECLVQDIAPTVIGQIRLRSATDLPSSDGHEQRMKDYERFSEQLFAHQHQLGMHGPELLAPTNIAEARGWWRGVVHGAYYNDYGQKVNYLAKHGGILDDEDALRFAVEDPECAARAVDAMQGAGAEQSGKVRQLTLELASSPHPEVRDEVAKAVSWHDGLVDVIAADPNPGVRTTIAARMGHMADQANGDRLARDTDLFQGHTAQSPRFGNRMDLIRVSKRLAHDPDTGVRRALASSAAWTDTKTQRTLAGDRDPMVRRTLAGNAGKSKLDEKAVKQLANDPEPGVREALLTSGAEIPARSLRRLLKDRDAAVAALAANRLRGPDLAIEDGRIQRTR